LLTRERGFAAEAGLYKRLRVALLAELHRGEDRMAEQRQQRDLAIEAMESSGAGVPAAAARSELAETEAALRYFLTRLDVLRARVRVNELQELNALAAAAAARQEAEALRPGVKFLEAEYREIRGSLDGRQEKAQTS